MFQQYIHLWPSWEKERENKNKVKLIKEKKMQQIFVKFKQDKPSHMNEKNEKIKE